MTIVKRMGTTRPAWLAACVALALGGCALFQPPAPPPRAPDFVPEAREHLPPPPPPKPRPPATLARLTPLGAEVPESLDGLIGFDEPQIAAVLGEPQSRAEAAPATIWRYSGTHCAIDIYFYLDLQSQAMRALHYEVRDHDLSERSAQRCYHTLVDEQRGHADTAAGADHPR
jgi:hypothetical protein